MAAVWRRCASHWRSCTAALPAPAEVTRDPCRAQPAPFSASRAMLGVCGSSRRRLTVSGQSRVCWSCQCVLTSSQLFCPACSSLQPPDLTKDYFHILHCDRSFDLNIQELQKKYRNLQRSLHPDYFSQKSQHEQEISDKQSSLVNKAYNTLLSPLTRGIYLLGLHGITFAEGTEGGDAPFLFEILEVNEQLNAATTKDEIEEIGNVIQEKCQELTENIQEAFQKGDLEGAKTFLVKMKYYTNILNQVKKKMLP